MHYCTLKTLMIKTSANFSNSLSFSQIIAISITFPTETNLNFICQTSYILYIHQSFLLYGSWCINISLHATVYVVYLSLHVNILCGMFLHVYMWLCQQKWTKWDKLLPLCIIPQDINTDFLPLFYKQHFNKGKYHIYKRKHWTLS